MTSKKTGFKLNNMKENKNQKSMEKTVTLKDLGEFTEEVILPGVENLLEPIQKEMRDLKEEMKSGFSEMKQGFKDISKSLRAIQGEIIDVKIAKESHENRIRTLEEKVLV